MTYRKKVWFRVAFYKIMVCHQGQLGSEVLEGMQGFESINLEHLDLIGPYLEYGSRLAETRAFAEPISSEISHVGFLSWRMGDKRGDGLSWTRIRKIADNLSSGEGFAPYLWPNQESLYSMSERSFPGMGQLVSKLFESFSPGIEKPWDVAGNSFIIPLHEYKDFNRFIEEILAWEVWRSEVAPFRYRCHVCHEISIHGHGRYTSSRDIALFLEVATIYYFRYLSTITMSTVPTTRIRTLMHRVKKGFTCQFRLKN